MTSWATFDEFMEHALYDPVSGFFGSTSGQAGGTNGAAAEAAGGQAGGAHGDFITSPETGPLFGLLVTRYLYRCWERLGAPEHFEVVEYAAGRGALAITIRAALRDSSEFSKFADALSYHMVERSERLRAMQTEHLTVIDAADPDASAASAMPDGGAGPVFYSHVDASTLPNAVDVVFANELLDNIPFALFERLAIDHPTEPDWQQVMVGPPDSSGALGEGEAAGASGPACTWVEHIQPGEPHDALVLGRLAPDAPVCARAPLQHRASEWLTEALQLVGPMGTVVVIDYCRSTADMALVDQSEWLRTYSGHARSGSPLESPGSRDITCDVAVDQLSLVRRPAQNVSQAEWLADLGIDELLDEGRRIWVEKASAPDLAAMRARSRVSEAEALCDPDGLGAFRVLIWQD